MEIAILPLVLGAIGLTFALAILGWWIAARVERRRRTTRRLAETTRPGQQPGGAQGPRRRG